VENLILGFAVEADLVAQRYVGGHNLHEGVHCIDFHILDRGWRLVADMGI
jgi:hypothetical protein